MLALSVKSDTRRSARGLSAAFAGPIIQLNADSGRAIVVVNSHSECPDVLVWSPATDARVLLAGRDLGLCPGIGSYLGVALAGNRAAWLMTSMGNALETYLYLTSLVAGRSPHVKPSGWLAWTRAHGQGYSGPLMANLYGDSGLLVYNFYKRCQPNDPDFPPDVPCPPGYAAGATSLEQIRLVLPARRVIATSDHDLTLLAAGGGRVVARLYSGGLIVLAPKLPRAPLVQHASYKAERLIATYPYATGIVQAAATDGRTLAVLRAGALDVIPLPGTTGTRTTRALPRPGTTRLVDLYGNTAVYLYRNAVYLLDLTTGRTVIFARPAARPVNAQLEPDGLYVAAGKTLTFTPRAEVEQRLHR
jgi:hypothetical protein